MLQNEFKNLGKKDRKRVWRWIAAWWWKTAWRWTKWQWARKSFPKKPWFEWWQTPLYRRLPKLKWFNNLFKVQYEVVNVGDLDRVNADEISWEELAKFWLISKWNTRFKVLGNWDIKWKKIVKTYKISEGARKIIEGKWWKVVLLEKNKKLTK